MVRRQARIFDLLRAVTAGAAGGPKSGSQLRNYARFGVARGALGMAGKFGEHAFSVELMTEGTIRSHAGHAVFTVLLIEMGGMREAVENGPGSAEAGERHQVFRIARQGGGVTRATQRWSRIRKMILEIAGVAGHAFVMVGALELYGSTMGAAVAQIAVQPS